MISLPLGRPAIMGVLNVTPDSFSDGGRFLDAKAAIERGLAMRAEGADFIDVGGESTRPGAEEVPEDEELRRVIPVVQGLAAEGLTVSIDTRKPAVALEATQAGAVIVNDVGGLRDPEMRSVCSRTGCTVCIMHMQGDPRTMQAEPVYLDVVAEVKEWLLEQATNAEWEGIEYRNIWLDPGIGFGKSVEHNLELLRDLGAFTGSGYPVLVGVSRKSFIGKVLGSPGSPLPVDERLEGGLAAQVWAQMKGARIIRTHDVRASRRVAEMVAAIGGSQV